MKADLGRTLRAQRNNASLEETYFPKELTCSFQDSVSSIAYYSLCGSPDAFNNMIAGAYCEGTNNICKVKTIIQDNGCLLFYHVLARSCSKQVAELPSED